MSKVTVERVLLKCKNCGHTWPYTPSPSRRKYRPEVARKYTTCSFCHKWVNIEESKVNSSTSTLESESESSKEKEEIQH